MNRITAKIGLAAALAAGLAVSAWAAEGKDGKGPTPEQRKEFELKRQEMMEKRLAKLPAEEQKLARALEPLRDSLMHAMGDYHHKVKEGAAARSLTVERANITTLESQIQKLQAENREVWLDLLADLPGPGMGPGGHGKGGPDGHHWKKDGSKGGPDCPMHHGDMGGDEPPPPPQD